MRRMANDALRQALLVEATFNELLHPRSRGKFRSKPGVPHRPLRQGEFPIGNGLPSGTEAIKPKPKRDYVRALADSDLSHGGVASPGVRKNWKAVVNPHGDDAPFTANRAFFDSPSRPMGEWTDEELRRAAEGSPGEGTYSRALMREMRKRNKARERAALEKFRAKRT